MVFNMVNDMILSEIGLEQELWLLDKDGNILEAPVYNFPADEMGFLIEFPGMWGSNPFTVAQSIGDTTAFLMDKAWSLGFNVEMVPWKPVTAEWQDYIAKKYNHASMVDHTKNIHGHKDTQHTGFRSGRATAGCHVHFSRWDTDKSAYVQFTDDDVNYIVKWMDFWFRDDIEKADRIEGEWEPKGLNPDDDTKKPHGFEYRSLPCTVNKYGASYMALKLLENLGRNPQSNNP